MRTSVRTRSATMVVGRPGEYTRYLMLRRRVAAAAASLVAALGALVAFLAAFGPSTVAGVTLPGCACSQSAAAPSCSRTSCWFTAGFAVAATFAAPHVRRRFKDGATRARIGLDAERRVASVLRRTEPQLIVHGALLGAGGDADHIVAGPSLVLVETKAGSGEVSVRDGAVIAGTRRIPGDPIAQATRQAAAVGRRLGTYCDAVVVVANGTGLVRTSNVTVCGATALPGVLAALEHRTLPSPERVAELLAAGE